VQDRISPGLHNDVHERENVRGGHFLFALDPLACNEPQEVGVEFANDRRFAVPIAELVFFDRKEAALFERCERLANGRRREVRFLAYGRHRRENVGSVRIRAIADFHHHEAH
jgi:hypothetical protein